MQQQVSETARVDAEFAAAGMTLDVKDGVRIGLWLGAHRKAQPAPPEPPGPWMDIQQCAAYIRRTPRAVEGLVARRDIPFNKRAGRIVFERDEIDRWLRRGAHRAAARNTR